VQAGCSGRCEGVPIPAHRSALPTLRGAAKVREVKENGERSSRLRPGRVRRATTPPPRVTGTARNLFRLVRLVSRSSPGGAKATPAFIRSFVSTKTAPFQRRAIVNVRYSSARTPGGWKAHGTYIERESAKGDRLPPEREAATEFDSQAPDPDRLGLAQEYQLGTLAESWQKAGDKRLFKIILSPEDANVDFQRTAAEMMARIEQHTGAPVEWGGVVHRNPGTLLLFPESIIPSWNGMHETRWASGFMQLKQQRTGLLIGTTIPIPNTEANRNVLLSRGHTERLSYVQRVPVPLGMWHFGDKRRGFPLMLRFPPTIRVWNRRAGILVCYEQLAFWPAIQTLAHNPDMLLAPSNVYWAANTPIPAIQHVAAQDWADLWAIPLYEANNR